MTRRGWLVYLFNTWRWYSIHLIFCRATHLLFIFDEIICICMIEDLPDKNGIHLHKCLLVFVFYCICICICLIGAFARHEWHPWRELLPGELSATDFAVVFACFCILLYLCLYWCDQDICGAAMAVWSELPPGGCPCLPLTLARRS